MKSLCLTQKSISKQRKFTEHEYHKHRPRKVLFSEHVCFVQICPVFAGPVTYIEMTNGLMERKPVETQLDKEQSEAEDFANRISTNIALLEKCNNDWLNVLKELKDDTIKVTEEHEYTHIVCEGWAYRSIIDWK